MKSTTKSKTKKPTGRPEIYTKELAAAICAELAQGKSLRTVCADPDMPAISTVFLWFPKHKGFSEQYAHAKEASADAMHEELSDLGDQAISLALANTGPVSNAVVNAVKLKADNLKWSMSKMKPKRYGEKLDLTSDGKKLPTPIMKINGLRRDDSNKENIGAR